MNSGFIRKDGGAELETQENKSSPNPYSLNSNSPPPSPFLVCTVPPPPKTFSKTLRGKNQVLIPSSSVLTQKPNIQGSTGDLIQCLTHQTRKGFQHAIIYPACLRKHSSIPRGPDPCLSWEGEDGLGADPRPRRNWWVLSLKRRC